MTDTTEIGVSDEILDEQPNAIHLVYLHGSIHRRGLVNDEQSIAETKKINAEKLAPVLKRHGVIVLGYSGWDDAIVDALLACHEFDNLLYWCGREADPLAAGAFGERVPDILRKPTAFYVKIEGAGEFMTELNKRLVTGIPRLLGNPIAQIRDLLKSVDLSELKSLDVQGPSLSAGPQISAGTNYFEKARLDAIERLDKAEQIFRPDSAPRDCSDAGGSASRGDLVLSAAGVAFSMGKNKDAIEMYTEFLRTGSQTVDRQAWALQNRGTSFYYLGEFDNAEVDWTRLIDLPGAPVEQVAKALVNRGITWAGKGETEKALADWTRLIDLSGAPVEQVAQALVNRGVTWAGKGETEKALADYTRAIDLPGAPVGQVATALVNRGFRWRGKGETEKALTDYTRVIDLPGAPVAQVARALAGRGVVWGAKGETEKELADYTRVIEELAGAPMEPVAQALGNRGWLHYNLKAYSAFLNDTQAALEKRPTLSYAAFNLGLAYLANGDDDRAMAAYKAAAQQFPNAIQSQGLPDLVEAQTTWLTPERAKPIVDLLNSFKP